MNEEEITLESLDLEKIPHASVEELLPEIKQRREEGQENALPPLPRPSMLDADAWFAYVMAQFTDDELPEGNPTADGCRRVVQKLLGPILYSAPSTILVEGQQATVGWKIKILWENEPGIKPHIRTFGDVANVTPLNTPEKYAIHAAATAATKAEGRALRKALNLRMVITAEEATKVEDDEDAGMTGKVNDGQIWTIDSLCRRLKVNFVNFINSGSVKYSSYKDIEKTTAVKMLSKLTEWQQQQDKIPEKLKGYDPNWRENYGS